MTIDLREHPATHIPSVRIESKVAPVRRHEHRTLLVASLALVGACIAVLASDAAPAGLGVVDPVYRAIFASLMVWAASRARRWTWPVLAGLATISTESLLGQAFSALALALAVTAIVHDSRRNSAVGALIAAITVPALLAQGAGPVWRLTSGRVGDTFGTSALIAAVACAPVLASAWKTLSRRRRRTIRRISTHVMLAIGGISIVAFASSAVVMPKMFDALESSRTATNHVHDAELDEATIAFERAAEQWTAANRILAAPWMTPARLVPVVGQHVRSSQVVTGQAAALNAAAAAMANRLHPDELVIDGVINIDELDALTPTAEALAATTERATERIDQARSPWLLPPFVDRVDRAVEILGRSSGIAGATAQALDASGRLLGRETPARILVMVTTPSEARGSGGFVGSWILLNADEGSIEIVEQHQSRELNSLLIDASAELRGDDQYVERYGRFDVERHIQDVTLSPDFPSVARITADLYQQATGIELDAVLMVDPFVLEKLLGFTGPMDIGGSAPLTGANAARHLLVDQYQTYDGAEAEREAGLATMTETLARTLLAEPPDPVAFVTELAPLAEAKRITLWLREDPDSSITDRLGLSGAFPASEDGLFALVHQNAGQNKIDAYLERTIELQTTLSPQHKRANHSITITLDNAAPASGLADAVIASNDQGLPAGTNRMMLSMYSSDELLSATLDGRPVPVERATEFGVNVFTVVTQIPANGYAVLEVELEGDMQDEDTYRMVFDAQPLVVADQVSWRVRADDASRIEAPESWSQRADGVRWSAPLESSESIEFRFTH